MRWFSMWSFSDHTRMLCKGEYGVNGLFVGVPVKLGRRGVEEVVKLALTADEQAALAKSAAVVKEHCDLVDKMI